MAEAVVVVIVVLRRVIPAKVTWNKGSGEVDDRSLSAAMSAPGGEWRMVSGDGRRLSQVKSAHGVCVCTYNIRLLMQHVIYAMDRRGLRNLVCSIEGTRYAIR